MQKANWHNSGDNIRLTMPIAKVNEETRQVFGYASLDNIDQHKDLVDAEASRRAFANFRGNIREQHDEKKAVGKMVEFKEDTVLIDDKFYQGIYVTAYVSKGASDTWEKVLDGTLSGFSIGGNVLNAKTEIDPLTGEQYRRVVEYELTELSLVDNPANQYANVVGFKKMADSEKVVMTGDLATITVENVFVCNKCLAEGHGVHKTDEDSLICPICGDAMVKIGFVESSDPNPKETIQKMVASHLDDRKGGVTETMPQEEEKVAVVEEVEVTEVKTEEEAPAATEEQAPAEEAKVEEVEEVADPLSEAVASLRALADQIDESHKAQAQEVQELKKSFETLDNSFAERLSTISGQVAELQDRQTEFSKKFEGIDSSFSEVRKSLTELDESTALRKSLDSDQTREEEKPKNIWAGSFLTTESL